MILMPLDTSTMTPAEARQHIDRLGISQQAFARMIRVSPQNVRKWLKLDGDALDIPRAVQILLRLISPPQARQNLALGVGGGDTPEFLRQRPPERPRGASADQNEPEAGSRSYRLPPAQPEPARPRPTFHSGGSRPGPDDSRLPTVAFGENEDDGNLRSLASKIIGVGRP